MRTIDLFDLAEMDPPHNGTETSRQAAASVRPHVVKTALAVLGCIRERGGATCDEVEMALGMRHESASARIKQLSDAGYVRDSGKKRPTRRGRPAVIWTVTEGVQP